MGNIRLEGKLDILTLGMVDESGVCNRGRKMKHQKYNLDIFQHYEMNDALAISNRLQQFRSIKAFEITYIKQK